MAFYLFHPAASKQNLFGDGDDPKITLSTASGLELAQVAPTVQNLRRTRANPLVGYYLALGIINTATISLSLFFSFRTPLIQQKTE